MKPHLYFLFLMFNALCHGQESRLDHDGAHINFPVLRQLSKDSKIVAHVKIESVADNGWDAVSGPGEGYRSWAVVAKVITPVKGTKADSLSFWVTQGANIVHENSVLVKQGKEYIVFLNSTDGSTYHPTTGKQERMYDPTDDWLGALPFDPVLLKILKAFAKTPDTVTPLCIVEIHIVDGKMLLTLNNQAITLQGLGEWLAGVKKDFDGNDPVAIRFGPDVSIGVLLDIRQVAMKTHHEVHLVLEDGRESSKPKELSISDFTPEWLSSGTSTPFQVTKEPVRRK